MPIVRSSANNVEYQAGLVLPGDIQHISGYAPDGNGEDVTLVFTEVKPIGKGSGPIRAPGSLRSRSLLTVISPQIMRKVGLRFICAARSASTPPTLGCI